MPTLEVQPPRDHAPAAAGRIPRLAGIAGSVAALLLLALLGVEAASQELVHVP